VIDIDLPRPRRLDRLSRRFGEYSTHIRNIFKSQGVLAWIDSTRDHSRLTASTPQRYR
jgi:hypothetical protein